MTSRKEAFEDAISATKAWPRNRAGRRPLPPAPSTRSPPRRPGDRTSRPASASSPRSRSRPSKIAANSAADGGVVVEKMRGGTGNFGFDAAAGTYGDLVEAGIIDPTKVVRLALENAVSVAGVLLLAEATMTEVREGKAERQASDEL
jgi:chaperonin GroEL